MKRFFAMMLVLLMMLSQTMATAAEQWSEYPEMGVKLLLTEESSTAGISVISQNNNIFLVFTDSSGVTSSLAEISVYSEEEYSAIKASPDYSGMLETYHMVDLGVNEGNGYFLISAADFGAPEDFLTLVLGSGTVAELGDRKAEWINAINMLPAITDSITFIPVVKAEKTVSAFTTVDIYGNTFTNEIFAQADLTVVNIWGTFCGPCIGEMPELGQWSREMPENVQIIGLVSDVYSPDDASTIGNAQAIVEATGVDFVNLVPAEGLNELLSISPYVPTTVFVDSTGKLVGEPVIGANVAEYKQFVEDYLSGLE